MQEVDNALPQTTREISSAYDLKFRCHHRGFRRATSSLRSTSPADFVSSEIIDVLSSKLIKRGIDLKAVSWDAPQAASGGTVRAYSAYIVEGIDQATAKKHQQGHQGPKLKGQSDHRGPTNCVFPLLQRTRCRP